MLWLDIVFPQNISLVQISLVQICWKNDENYAKSCSKKIIIN